MTDDVLVLTFHGIGVPGRSVQLDEANVWVAQDLFSEVLDVVQGRDDVQITFDDGNCSDIAIALPMLLHRKLKAKFFVVADRTDRQGFLGKNELRELLAAGMEIGSHGMYHRPWRNLSEPEMRVEIDEARDLIEQSIGTSVTAVACPFGSYGRRALRRLRRSGFDRVYTSDRGWAKDSDWLRARNTIHRMDCAADVCQLLDGGGHRRPVAHRLKLALKKWR
jgi:peptidoglycan/xylan/chitin deacetylase (PgdA/CDA1 family)